ncbi:hypothetical protein JCM19235_3540 [Vibrio maritimus]|uniref:Uncharacterized protein n=1 Tax=Vibrio maritimus TaxID=990268 RepID=A0A090S189_9VIBR|nr:hypothetical protein JCM19235_3540 [Vibrio maritimus]
MTFSGELIARDTVIHDTPASFETSLIDAIGFFIQYASPRV